MITAEYLRNHPNADRAEREIRRRIAIVDAKREVLKLAREWETEYTKQIARYTQKANLKLLRGVRVLKELEAE